MSDMAAALLRQILALTESDRAELAGAILESLEPPADASVDEAWRAEIARRVARLEAGEATIPWEQVRDQLYARLRGAQG